MSRRSALLVSAVVIAALGTLLVFLYVKNVQDNTYADQQPVKVLVAKTSVEIGTPAQKAAAAGAFEEKTLPSDAVPADALPDAGSVAAQVTVVPILPGQVVQASMFADQSTSGQLPVEKTKLGVSVQLGDPERVAGFVEPGSKVAIFATVTQGDRTYTKLLVPNASVTAVGPTTAVTTTTQPVGANEETTEQIPAAILTLSVNQRDAEKIIFAQSQGKLYFALTTSDSVVRPGGGVTYSNLWN
jgi:pilus assembly protein CpaB